MREFEIAASSLLIVAGVYCFASGLFHPPLRFVNLAFGVLAVIAGSILLFFVVSKRRKKEISPVEMRARYAFAKVLFFLLGQEGETDGKRINGKKIRVLASAPDSELWQYNLKVAGKGQSMIASVFISEDRDMSRISVCVSLFNKAAPAHCWYEYDEETEEVIPYNRS